ncbi:NAD(P)H-hydrate epimerase [Zancudomyces culisetae]|uniref:Enhancer of mRNA-decapping protein 3 n=1 Tax=Zancudomyces culisetae TaxID=1213189 RepID=A0A1R1PDH1_ZANCU|nr:NAD(P)H-hydrate epimerase [Zancudomyces culisetae]|eukprot:OMH79045.1 NAD(P)H-hydrate epimerase [Zancudomyces culisetae]
MMGSLTVEKKIGGENESNKEKRKEEADMSSYSRQQGQNGRYTPKQRERNGKVYNSGSKGKGTKDTWMNEDVSRYNQEFDFEANLMLFDKKTIFEEIRNKESKDESELLVNINKPKGSQSKTPVAAGWKESGVGMGVAVGVGGGGFRGAKGEKVGVMEAAEWKRVEEYAKKEYGIDEQVIIEMAGYLGAEKICKEMERGGRVLVIAGNGRNGSYGLTAAKRLVNKGYEVDVILMFRSKRKTSAMNTQLVKTIKANGGKIYKEIAKYEGLDKVEVVVDAIYSANSSDSINRRNVQKVAGLIEKNGARGHRTKLVSFEYPLIRGVLANTLRIEELRQEEGGMSSSFSTDSESEGSERGGSKDSQGRYGGESIIASSHVIVFGVPNRSVQQQVVGSRVYVADIGMPQTAYKAVFGNNKDVMDNKNIFRQSSMVEIKSL